MVRLIVSRSRCAFPLFLIIVLGTVGTTKADFTFGEPALFDEPVNSPGLEYFDYISADGLEVCIERPVEERIDSPRWDFYVSTRETRGDPWSVPVKLGPPVNSDYDEGFACLSGDGLELYFTSNRPGGQGGRDIWVATRPTRFAPWATAVNLGPTINTPSLDTTPWITPDGLGLYFSSNRPGGYGGVDIWVVTRASTNDAWGEPANLGPPVNDMSGDYYPSLSSNGRVLFFSGYDNPNSGIRPGGRGQSDLWMTRRRSDTDPWESPVNLGEGMNTHCWDCQPRISADSSVLYFTSSRPDASVWITNPKIWQAPIIPIVDFNGDGEVDGAEVSTMAGLWGTDDSLCDIGPMALGDGVVGVKDLKVLAEYIGKAVVDATLVAHWAFDEIEGDVAYDSSYENDAEVIGNATWQPEAGAVAGALEVNGIDTYVETPSVLNPADRPFSVLAWIKGGASGQAIISQIGGVNWFTIDALTGALATELVPPLGRVSVPPLVSEAVITDGVWHRLVFVWDGKTRSLYVDGELVASDEQDKLAENRGGLYIGCGADRSPDSFFSGLIDDVRIYNRAVRP